MPIIKRNLLEDKGVLYLEEGKLRFNPPAMPDMRPREEVKISEDELPLLGPIREKAQRIIADAEEEARRTFERAKAEGFKQGIEEGKVDAESKIGDEFSEALETLNQAIKERKRIIKDAESEVLRLALKVAEQIIRSEVSLHRDVCLNIVSEAIGRVSDREQIIIKVNREDIDQIKKYKDQIVRLVDGVKSFSILEDSTVEPGGCVIETNIGYIDARISTKLKAIDEAFRKVESNGQ